MAGVVGVGLEDFLDGGVGEWGFVAEYGDGSAAAAAGDAGAVEAGVCVLLGEGDEEVAFGGAEFGVVGVGMVGGVHLLAGVVELVVGEGFGEAGGPLGGVDVVVCGGADVVGGGGVDLGGGVDGWAEGGEEGFSVHFGGEVGAVELVVFDGGEVGEVAVHGVGGGSGGGHHVEDDAVSHECGAASEGVAWAGDGVFDFCVDADDAGSGREG